MIGHRGVVVCGSLAALLLAGCASRQRENVAGVQAALGRELVEQREWTRAFAVADALCRTSPKEPEGYLLRGIVYREQKLHTEAEADLKEALRLDRKSARAHSALALLYELQARSEDAVEHHRRAADLEPGNPQYLNNLGFSLFVHAQPREAIEILLKAVRTAPADRRIRNNLGFAFAATGDLTRAAEQFELGGSRAEAKTNLGWAYERRGSLPQAFDAYTEALRLDPATPAARHNLNRVAKDLGRDVPPDVAAPPGA